MIAKGFINDQSILQVLRVVKGYSPYFNRNREQNCYSPRFLFGIDLEYRFQAAIANEPREMGLVNWQGALRYLPALLLVVQ